MIRKFVTGAAFVLSIGACAPDPAPSNNQLARTGGGNASLASNGGSVGTARAATPSDWPTHYALGRNASLDQIALLDTDVDTTGAGLPAGRGVASDGAWVYGNKCAVCHGPAGEGIPPNPPLVKPFVATDSFPWAKNPAYPKTVGNYWPFATTLYSYIRHSMPLAQPGSLTPNETYQLVAYLLVANGVIPRDSIMDARSLPSVRLPLRARFVLDNRQGGAEFK